MLSNKPVIGVVFGGKSSEHEVSIKSAKTIYNALSHLSIELKDKNVPIAAKKNVFFVRY